MYKELIQDTYEEGKTWAKRLEVFKKKGKEAAIYFLFSSIIEDITLLSRG